MRRVFGAVARPARVRKRRTDGALRSCGRRMGKALGAQCAQYPGPVTAKPAKHPEPRCPPKALLLVGCVSHPSFIVHTGAVKAVCMHTYGACVGASAWPGIRVGPLVSHWWLSGAACGRREAYGDKKIVSFPILPHHNDLHMSAYHFYSFPSHHRLGTDTIPTGNYGNKPTSVWGRLHCARYRF